MAYRRRSARKKGRRRGGKTKVSKTYYMSRGGVRL